MLTGVVTRKDGGSNFVIKVERAGDDRVVITLAASALGTTSSQGMDTGEWKRFSRKYRPVTEADAGLIGYDELMEMAQ
jgi:hypothetical protein